MTEPLSVQQMAQRLMTADNILILCHKNPDGDTIGCGSALYCALKALDKNVAVLCSDAIPNRYAFTNAHMFKGEFEPQILKKNQTSISQDIEEKILSMYAKGMTTGDIETHIQDIYGISPEECVAFGDYMNDYEMLQNCGESYAMENAHDEIKKVAKYIAPSNDDEGVMQVLKKIL